jgi:hypothetical protein
VDVPKQLADDLPPVHLRADGQIVIQDSFDGASGSLDSRKPKTGKGTWKVTAGNWTVQDGAALTAVAPAAALIDAGVNDYEVNAMIEMRGPPDFPGLVARADRAPSTGEITARYLWQSAWPEIEVWDRPADTPENLRDWGNRPTVLINATNITGLIQPGEQHVLRLVVRGNRGSYYRDDTLVGTAPAAWEQAKVTSGPKPS